MSTLILDRRALLSALAWTGAASALPVWSRTAFAAANTDKRLVIVILRGALDGLTALAPLGDPAYASARGMLALEAAGDRPALKLDSMFALHPSLPNFHSLFGSGELRPLHGVAIPVRQRSHFEAQAILETGLGNPGPVGWLNRAVKALGQTDSGHAVAFQAAMPLILSGDGPATTYTPPLYAAGSADYMDRLATMYGPDPILAAAFKRGREIQGAATAAAHADGDAAVTRPGEANAAFVSTAKLAGQLLATTQGPNIAVLEAFGWDTHVSEGAGDGVLARALASLDDAMMALRTAAQAVWSKTAVVIVTEFGRTVRPNGTKGTDHGTAAAAFVLGGAVKGGMVTADWPGLADAQLFEGRDLRPTMDIRSVFKGVLASHLGLDRGLLDRDVFPDSGLAAPLDGLIKA